MSIILDSVALSASCFSLFFIIRAKRTYFLDSGFFIAIATIGFMVYLGEATYSDVRGSPVSMTMDTLLFAIMGISIGMASYLLKNSSEMSSTSASELTRFASKPPTPFLLFSVIVLAWTLAALIFQPWMVGPPDGNGNSTYSYAGWFVAGSALFLTAFIGLPVVSFYRQSRTVQEKTAALSMKVISMCWAAFAVSLFLPIALGGIFPAAQSVGFVVDSLLFVVISFAFREPTVLARIVTAGETVNQVIGSRSDADTIVLYNTESDRKKLVETLVRDGVAMGQTVICRVAKSEVPFYRALMKSADLSTSSEKQEVIIKPIEGSFVSDDTTRVIHLSDRRELVDLDELGLQTSKEIINKIIDSDEKNEKSSTGRIWALNVDAAQAGILDLLTSQKPGSRVVDLALQQDIFSKLLGLKHQDILGSRILLEYEPTSSYEEVVQKFIREFQANVESTAIFTNAGSPVYRDFSEQRNIRLFTSSTKTSTPSKISDQQVLLPERDTSLLLDAVDKLMEAHSGRRIGIVFEVLTYLMLSLGFEKAYGVISSVVEMVECGLATILVLVNSDALEARTLSGLRGLFQTQLFYDSSGLKVIRRAGAEYSRVEVDESSSELGENLPRKVRV